jgi:hypothetical protein
MLGLAHGFFIKVWITNNRIGLAQEGGNMACSNLRADTSPGLFSASPKTLDATFYNYQKKGWTFPHKPVRPNMSTSAQTCQHPPTLAPTRSIDHFHPVTQRYLSLRKVPGGVLQKGFSGLSNDGTILITSLQSFCLRSVAAEEHGGDPKDGSKS